jgi:hypothetical protein
MLYQFQIDAEGCPGRGRNVARQMQCSTLLWLWKYGGGTAINVNTTAGG